MNCSIALQVLPLDTENKIAVIDRVIAYLKSTGVALVVTPFETVLEGDYEQLMAILKNAIALAGEQSTNVFANVKINYGDIMSIDEKITPHR